MRSDLFPNEIQVRWYTWLQMFFAALSSLQLVALRDASDGMAGPIWYIQVQLLGIDQNGQETKHTTERSLMEKKIKLTEKVEI